MREKALDVDEYIARFPHATQLMLLQMRKVIKAAAPSAEELISYAMPAYKLNGMLVYFAGFARHIGFYPGTGGVAAFKDELTGYKTAKGSIQFPLDKPLPLEFIARIVGYRVTQNAEREKSRTAKK